jgi:hypothetical protein
MESPPGETSSESGGTHQENCSPTFPVKKSGFSARAMRQRMRGREGEAEAEAEDLHPKSKYHQQDSRDREI